MSLEYAILWRQNPQFYWKEIGVRAFYLTIRLQVRDFYEVIVDEGEARINYHLIEIKSE